MRSPLLLSLTTFAVVLGVLAILNRPSAPAQPPAPAQPLARDATTAERIDFLQSAARRAPGDADLLVSLGQAYSQRARETGDSSLYPRAEAVLRRALELDRRSVAAVSTLGAIALARHDFVEALALGRRARRMAPDSIGPFPVVVDALIELGRYDDAREELQRLLDRKPGLPAYARVSYYRELHGDIDGAIEAMRLAVSAGGEPENVAYVTAILGNLEFARGRTTAARRAYRAALRVSPDHPPALVGLARTDAGSGRLERAVRRLQTVVNRLPLPEYVIALGETALAAGHEERARDQFALVRAQQRLLEGRGVDTDVELALFEADHGDARRAVELARRAWSAAPSVRSADAMGWALTRAGRPARGHAWMRRALARGWKDPLVLYHAGMSAARAGRTEDARRHLRAALDLNPRFSPLYAPRARQALEDL